MLSHFSKVKVYFDDIIIFDKTREEHKLSVLKILNFLNSNNIAINYDKCEFLKEEISYLRLIIDGKGIRPDISRLNHSKIMFIPNTKK